ncbi:hypothetical protein MKX01_026166 [Papaver californicum]|nr:hypothetical protein MKX01_026166 [Papaver californicum]
MEDLQRTLALTGLSVSTTAEKGRCLISTRNFSPGDVIITQEPYVCVPNNSSESKCDGCFKSVNLKKCSACQVPWYCGSTCQKSEWKLHRLECQALAGLSKERRKSLTPSLRLMVRLYLKRKLQNERVFQTTATDNYNLVEALVDHMSDIGEKQLVLYAQMANLVNLILEWPNSSIKEIAQNFSKLACNAHTICGSELRPLGTGLYPVISIINHSCSPNAVLVIEGRRAVVRAVELIPQGTEHCSTQKAVKEQYFFTCSCPICRKGIYMEVQESAILEGYGCKSDKCNGFLLRDSDDRGFVCQTCGLVRSKEELLKISTDVKQMEDQASQFLSSGNYLEASVVYRNIEQLQLKLCHPLSINLMRTREGLLKILMELEDWRGALTYSRYVIPAYQRMFLGDTEDAIKSLTKAVYVLQTTHGTNTPFMRDLLVRLDAARAEAAHKL